MRKVIILGGSFDPVHKVHLEIASIASQRLGIKEVWFLLANNPRWKDEVSAFEHRYQMLKLVLSDFPDYKIALEEKDNVMVNYTIDTAYRLIDKYPDIQFYYLIGSDQLERLHEWKEIDDLSKIFQFVHIRRKHQIENLENIDKYHVINLEIEPIMASSTMARNGDFTLVDQRVKKYILDHYLYLENRMKNDLSTNRFEHSLHVAILAKEIAIANNFDAEKAFAAGMLHDCGKETSYQALMQYMEEYYPNEKSGSKSVYHQYYGAFLAHEKYGISDDEIISSIAKHATADKNMSTLDKIIYCADKLEESRGYDSQELIAACKRGIHGGFKQVLKSNVEYLKSQNITISSKTQACLAAIDDNETRDLLQLIVGTLDRKKVDNILIIDVSDFNPLAQYYVLCSALSERHTLSLAEELKDILDKHGFNIHHIEGRSNPQWVLLDANAVIVHLFTHIERERYNLEKILYKQKFLSIQEVMKDEK